jgi:hypothetical protein
LESGVCHADVAIVGVPQAWIYKDLTYGGLTARVCGGCGYAELHAKNFRPLSEKYDKTQQLEWSEEFAGEPRPEPDDEAAARKLVEAIDEPALALSPVAVRALREVTGVTLDKALDMVEQWGKVSPGRRLALIAVAICKKRQRST